jgi:TFIIF-interacting CTD phosphatase-like protein
MDEFKKGYEILRKAEIYAQRMDWYLAGDDGEDSFLERLEDELDILSFELSVKEFEKDEDFED